MILSRAGEIVFIHRCMAKHLNGRGRFCDTILCVECKLLRNERCIYEAIGRMRLLDISNNIKNEFEE